MASCRECSWWTRDWKGIAPNEGACMLARSEPDGEGIARPIVSDAPLRAVGDDGREAASLITRGAFYCSAFAPR